MGTPLVLDIDGTLTRPDERRTPAAIDPRIATPLRDWSAPIILATGKALPYPVALSQFIGIPPHVIAETGGIALAETKLHRFVDIAALADFREVLFEEGFIESETFDDSNYWREVELAVKRHHDLEELAGMARSYGLEVLDSGYAYHVKDPSVSKGEALAWIAEERGLALSHTLAIGDSINDISTFERVGQSIALGNADSAAKAAADEVIDEEAADGALSILNRFNE